MLTIVNLFDIYIQYEDITLDDKSFRKSKHLTVRNRKTVVIPKTPTQYRLHIDACLFYFVLLYISIYLYVLHICNKNTKYYLLPRHSNLHPRYTTYSVASNKIHIRFPNCYTILSY